MFVHIVPIQFHKLLQNGCMTTGAFGGKLDRVVEVAIHIIVVFVIGILRPKDVATGMATKVFKVEFLANRRNVGSFQSITAMITRQIESSKVIPFTKWLL